jgi:hypothetical protein
MDGIIRHDNREHRLSGASQFISCDEMLQESSNDWTHVSSTGNTEIWSPPESWAVRKPQPNDQQFFLEDNIMDDTSNEKLDDGKKSVIFNMFRNSKMIIIRLTLSQIYLHIFFLHIKFVNTYSIVFEYFDPMQLLAL